jgi:diguanylate cyclase (GGDEF)-like protein
MSVRKPAVWLLVALFGAILQPLHASTRVEDLLDRAEQSRSVDPDAFNGLLKQLDEASAEATAGQAERLAYLHAYADIYAGRYDQAIGKAQRILAASPSIGMQVRAQALVVNGYALSRRFAEGLRALDRLYAVMHKAPGGEPRQHALLAAANLYNQVGQYRLGLRDVGELLRELGPGPSRAHCFASELQLELNQNLGNAVAKEQVDAVVGECASLKEGIVVNLARTLLAKQLARESKYEEAIGLLESILPEAKATRYPRLISDVYSLLGEFHMQLGNTAVAASHAASAVAQASSGAELLPLVRAHKVLYQVAAERGSWEDAFQFYRRYAEADKAYLSDVNARELAYQIVRQETQQKTQEIALLNQQNRVLQLQQQVDRQSAANTRTLMLMLMLLTGVIGYWAYRVKRMEQTLRHRAEVDALTGICNRQHFTARAEKTLLDCGRAGEEVGLIMFDLDHFKSINDRFGHRAGDWVLQRVAQVCRDLSRQVDYLGRIGGEEFAFLLRGQDARGATRLADDCRMRLAAIDTGETGFSFPVTASFGVTSTALSGYGLASLLSHADKALYRAKHEGRNRVCVYLPEEVPWQPATLPSVAEPTAQPEPAATGAAHDQDGQPAPPAGPPHLRIVPK